ncbi:hemolysin family protein [Desertihabitans aurantiacus]|uniref:hemolysin family protein n=1 Tax=Desertihabitans aurantiacus TaxID=2282477 RepID=UPI0018E4FB28|nr:hemolysin family protein [Desertihabitans aurantiacus]
MTFDLLMLGVGIVLTIGTGLFVASEFSLVNLDRGELEARQSRGEKRLGPTIGALRTTSTHLSSAQLGITLTTLLTGYTFEPAMSRLLERPLTTTPLPDAALPVIGMVVGVGLATLLSMLIGELVPKNFALALPLHTAKLVVPFQIAFTTVFKPLVLLFNGTANAVIRSMGIEPKEELSGARSAEELSSLVRRSAREGQLDADHATLLSRTLRFTDHSAGEVMTPRVQMAKLSVDDDARAIIDLARQTGYSRFPVIGEDVDDIVGVVHVKAAFGLDPDQLGRTSVRSLMVEPLRVPELMGVERLLGLLRTAGFQIAVVTDEYGGTAGIVTLEDLVEELVGELEDEHDRARIGLVRHRDGSVVFNARLRPDELLERTGIDVPDDDEYETVGGFVIDVLDRLPEVGDEVRVRQGVLRVERLDGPTVERLRFIEVDPDPDGANATAPTRTEGEDV